MKIQIKYILIFLILMLNTSSISGLNEILNPSFEDGEINWEHFGYMPDEICTCGMCGGYGQQQISTSWASDGINSLCIEAVLAPSAGGSLCYDRLVSTDADAVYQNIDFTNIDKILFDTHRTFSMSGDCSGVSANMSIVINTTTVWFKHSSALGGDETFLFEEMDVSEITGIQSLYCAVDITCFADGWDTPSYEVNSYFDNFTIIYTPSPPVPEITTFDNLFNCSTLWCMLTIVFTNYEDKCSGGGISLFWTIIVLIPFTMTWIKQQSVIIPSILALITGSTLFALLPDTAMSSVIPLLSLGIMGILYHIIKSR